MQPTEELKTEHGAIKRMLRVLDVAAARVEQGEPTPPEDLAAMLDFIRTFADRCHHAKEEGLLFPAMERAGMPAQGGPIGVMLSEHDLGRGHVRGMQEALDSGLQDRATAGRFAEHARGYIALLSAHIVKEDEILYPIADRLLSDEDQEELEEGFERVEREVVGEGVHEAYHRLLDRLDADYPPQASRMG